MTIDSSVYTLHSEMLVSPFVFLIKCKNKHLAVWVARSFLCAADARLDSEKHLAFWRVA